MVEIEERLEAMRAELADLPAAIEQAERELDQAQSRLDNSWLIYDVAGAEWAAAADRLQGSGGDAGAPWRPATAEQAEAAEQDHREAWARFQQARDEH